MMIKWHWHRWGKWIDLKDNFQKRYCVICNKMKVRSTEPTKWQEPKIFDVV